MRDIVSESIRSAEDGSGRRAKEEAGREEAIHGKSTLLVSLQGSDKGLKAVGHSLLVGIQSVDEAKKSPHWEDIRTAMDEEMAGKIANKYGDSHSTPEE